MPPSASRMVTPIIAACRGHDVDDRCPSERCAWLRRPGASGRTGMPPLSRCASSTEGPAAVGPLGWVVRTQKTQECSSIPPKKDPMPPNASRMVTPIIAAGRGHDGDDRCPSSGGRPGRADRAGGSSVPSTGSPLTEKASTLGARSHCAIPGWLSPLFNGVEGSRASRTATATRVDTGWMSRCPP
jgi:hypothetical protein